MARFQQDDVAAALPILSPAGALEDFHRSGTRNDGQSGHYTGTSISRTATVTGMPLAARASTQA